MATMEDENKKYELDVKLELLQEKAQLVRSLRKLGLAQGEALRSLCAEMKKLLFMLRAF